MAKELIITLKFSLGEAPDLSELRKAGTSLSDYAWELLQDFELPSPFDDVEVELFARVVNCE